MSTLVYLYHLTVVAICPRDCTTYYPFLSDEPNASTASASKGNSAAPPPPTPDARHVFAYTPDADSKYTDTQWSIIQTLTDFYYEKVLPLYTLLTDCK